MPETAPSIRIGDRVVGRGRPTYVIAELSANHRGSLDEAMRVVRAAKEAGADAIKLQTYTPDTITIRSDAPLFRHGKGSLWEGKTLYDLYGEAYTPWEWQPKLQAEAGRLGLDCFSSPFDPTAVEFLRRMDVPAYKIASFELVDLPLIRKAAATGKPVILSTGMATLEEIEEGVAAARQAGSGGVALLKCTSAYPAPPEELNLRAIPELARRFTAPVGLSDHTTGIVAPVVAVSLGASIVEKHLTISRAAGGPDSAFSLEPHEFRELVDAVRAAERSLGEARFEPTPLEAESRRFRRSLFVVKPVRRGEPFTEDNVRSIRPAGGLAPKHLDQVVGKRAARDLEPGTPLAWDLVESPEA